MPLGTNSSWGGTNGVVTLGMTNQWHFYVITNTGASDYTNAAFITFFPATLSIPRMGVFAGFRRPTPRGRRRTLTFMWPGRMTQRIPLTESEPGGHFQLCQRCRRRRRVAGPRRHGICRLYQFQRPAEVYYIGVYSEDQMASEYGFVPIFTGHPVQPAWAQRQPDRQRLTGAGRHSRRQPGASRASPTFSPWRCIPMEVQASS